MLVLARGRDQGGLEQQYAAADRDLAALAPRDAAEARLAALFLATAEAAARELAYARLASTTASREGSLRAADRLTRTAVTLGDAIDRRRRPAEQRIVVEQRVAVAEGGRAMAAVAVQAGGGGADRGRYPA
jgi:hypothetical protein